ncbi:MAG TPA: cytochrome c3 family protein [Pyrinomonadaceae bacterium]
MKLTKRQLGSVILLLVSASYAFQNRRTPPKPAPVDYSKFSHRTPKHQGECNTCHKIPSRGWQKASTFPDIADYPGHDACVSCHRNQFFKGVRPVICSVCHPKTSPREEARYPFRNPATKLQFTIEFPHDRHQDVIALLQKPPTQRVAHHADNAQSYNNCTICHGERSIPAAVTWPDSYVPRAETFKSSPTGHGSCFNCHWKNQEPVATNCNGCHKLAPSPFSSLMPQRISLKFMHEGGGDKKVHIAECTTCHINITKSATLRGLKPDVPITACSECHNREGLRQDVSKELAAIDKNKAFACVYCHTSDVGSLDPPASHYLIAERPPLKRKEIK